MDREWKEAETKEDKKDHYQNIYLSKETSKGQGCRLGTR